MFNVLNIRLKQDLNKKIIELESRELNLDEMEMENSVYIIENRLKQRFNKVKNIEIKSTNPKSLTTNSK